ncbi:DUF3078 domain-containing protein [Gaoshiqia sediminis]|uniref:DUF3078 domain-containing protein n=1 Tax=Gaoshiqia sediminis TaxID=2986998 RepID=A0AA41Y3Z9_9BACT|nr:DUF3078 domain-containing protein [Gaoshiqia sediminis]MCW0483036.1 DUF3078 domain-containing protein [Gaoshiqia sediminis]
MNYRFLLLGIFFAFSSQILTASSPADKRKETVAVDSVKVGVNYLKYFLGEQGNWYPYDPELARSLRGLVNFVEDEKIDTILHKLGRYQHSEQPYFYRRADQVSDSLFVSGFMSQSELTERLKRIDRSVRNSIVKDQIPVPEQLLENLDSKVDLLDQEDAEWLLETQQVKIPDSLTMYNVIPDSIMSNPSDFRRIQRLDSTKRALLEQARMDFNNRVLTNYVDSVTAAYREEYISEYSKKIQREFADSIRTQNRLRLVHYNDSVMAAVNDSIARVVEILTNYAANDSTSLLVTNSDHSTAHLWLRDNDHNYTRLFIKNEQNDSLSVRIENTGKNSLRLLIDDGVTLSRFAQKQTKEFDFNNLLSEGKLQKVEKRFAVITPWNMGGDGTVGFTQTYLSNWKKGGQSALSTLVVLRGYANYSSKKLKWENSAEIRNGWLKSSEDKIQKNDDKFEITSRLGLSAFKKWYYSTEIDFQTQLFNGYKYPDRDNLISGFLSPAKTMIKFGLDYKPNKDFSLFISPLTAKIVSVRDTARIDVTKYGIEAGKKRYWEPGLNADLKLKKDITPDITYELKYKMFVNYTDPASFDIDWENNVVMKLNDYINMRVLLHFIYDANVTFPTDKIDLEGNTIYKPKLQFKEFITIGFSYKLNKQVYRRQKLK